MADNLSAPTVRAYKGFNPDLTCRGFQYVEGKTYETDHAELCRTGFHACPCRCTCGWRADQTHDVASFDRHVARAVLRAARGLS